MNKGATNKAWDELRREVRLLFSTLIRSDFINMSHKPAKIVDQQTFNIFTYRRPES